MTIDERISAELRSHAPEVDEHPAWDRIRSQAPVQRRSRTISLVAVPAAAAGLLLVGSILVSTLSSGPAPAGGPQSPFVGTWASIDGDGSTPTARIEVSTDGVVEIVVVDDYASVCSGAPATMTGTGRFQGDTELVIAAPVLTCDDGSQPNVLTGPPLVEQLRNLTFVHDPQSDTLTDNFGSVWARESIDVPEPEPTISILWPQSSLEKVREAQRLADSGDPDFTWQLEPELEESLMFGPDEVEIPEIFRRFLRERLGWEEFSSLPGPGFGDGTIILSYLRCAPGQGNPLYPDDPKGGRCAPTIDDVRYETVEIRVAQPARQDPSGIWVVTEWENLEPIEQVIPPTDVEATAMLEAFLQARIDGEGAEQYFGGGDGTAPLLYATSAGAPYERYEFELVSGPEWPSEGTRFEVRLYAEGGQTVVESSFIVERDMAGSLGLEIGTETLENGQPLAQLHHDILGGEVTFYTEYPWEGSLFGPSFESNGEAADTKLDFDSLGRLYVLADPLPVRGCQEGPPAADAQALAQTILSDDDLEATAPVATAIGGAPALRMDLMLMTAGPQVCSQLPRSYLTSSWFEASDRIRLYLVDLPEGSSADILAIFIGAPESQFETVVGSAAPILDSFEFHTG